MLYSSLTLVAARR